MQSPVQVAPLTLEDYTRLYSQDGPFEILDGERKTLVPPVMLHVITLQALFLILHQYCSQHALGVVFSEAPFVLLDKQNWVRGSRVPDAMFVKQARWLQYQQDQPEWRSKPLILVPDLVVEVVSPTDLYTDVQNKVAHYLADGVQLIWVIDPTQKSAVVYQGDYFQTLTTEGTLDGGEVIPGLSVPLSEVFSA
ncbi:MAG: Uma2 family endonuclease [Anaerolineae bacterium]